MKTFEGLVLLHLRPAERLPGPHAVHVQGLNQRGRGHHLPAAQGLPGEVGKHSESHVLLTYPVNLTPSDNMVAWITGHLTSRPQYIGLQGTLSDGMGDTGAPQGTVLRLFFFTISTSDFSFNCGTRHLQKFSDDSSIVGSISEDEEEEHRGVVEFRQRFWGESPPT